MRRAGLARPHGRRRHHARPAAGGRRRGRAPASACSSARISTRSSTPAATTAISASSPASSRSRSCKARGIAAALRARDPRLRRRGGRALPEDADRARRRSPARSTTAMLDLTDAGGMTMRDALAAFGGDPEHLAAEAYRRAGRARLSRGAYRAGAGARAGGRAARRGQRHRQPGPLPLQRARRGRPCRHRADDDAPRRAGRRGRDDAGHRGGGAARAASPRWSARSARSGCRPARSNVIPGSVEFSLDLRAADDAARVAAADEIR